MPNGRCRMHGGKSTGAKDQTGNTNAAKPGSLYSKFFTPEEQKARDLIELGAVDNELRLIRIRLARELAHEQKHGHTPELDTTIKREGGGPSTVTSEVHKKQRDYIARIDRLVARIESLEKTRIELAKIGSDDDTPPESKTFVFNIIDGRKDPHGNSR